MKIRLTTLIDIIDYPDDIKERIIRESFSFTFTWGDMILAVASYIFTDNTVSFELRERLKLPQVFELMRYLKEIIKRIKWIINTPMIAWVALDQKVNVKFVEKLGFIKVGEKEGYGEFVNG